jgi:hypothetical protein
MYCMKRRKLSQINTRIDGIKYYQNWLKAKNDVRIGLYQEKYIKIGLNQENYIKIGLLPASSCDFSHNC